MTLRNYISPEEIQAITGPLGGTITDIVLNQAEQMIDNAIANFYNLPWRKAYQGSLVKSGLATDSTLTITGDALTQNSLSRTVIQILTGAKAGKQSYVSGNTSNVITFVTIAGLSGTVEFRVYQLGKAPFASDVYNNNKVINEAVKNAVAYQVEAMLNFDNLGISVKDGKNKKSESIGTSYSYTLDDKANGTKSALELLAPQSAQSLVDAGLTFQSAF